MSEFILFDDVLDDLMLEEDHPTPEALARWQKRYPQFRDSLASFFETWAHQESFSDQPAPKIDEEKIIRKGVEYGLEILKKQGRLISSESTGPLSERDQLVLTAVYLLGGKGYPVTIAWKVGEMQGKNPLLGLMYASLDSLERKGLILVRPADPIAEPENAGARDYYTVTMAGSRVLADAKQTSALLARFLPDFA